MQHQFIKYILTNETMHALFRTLVHSLWQAILLALIAAITLMRTKKSGAAVRYKLLSGILVSFIFISIATFCYELNDVAGNNNTALKNVSVIGYNTLTNNKHQAGFTEKIISAFQQVENLTVVLWLIIIMLKCINLLTGLRSIYLLKRRQVFNAGEYWNSQLKELAAKAGVTKQIRLLKSAIVKVPMVLGHLKPVILFPASALTTLAPAEIEAILLHELAHICRKDYLINILQSITEIIFFFNPAVLWISSLIKEERENCCDDIAVGQMGNKKQFIHALVSFQEYNLDSKYAASFSGRRNYLLNRIRRIITNNNKTLNNMEKILLTAGIIVTCCAVFAFSQNKQSVFTTPTATAQVAKTFTSVNKKDTVPQTIKDNESKYTINTSMDGKQYRLVEVNGKVTELYVNNTRIPDDKISEYNSVINKLQEKLKADKQKQAEAMKAESKALEAQKELMQANASAIKAEMQKRTEDIQAQANELQAEAMRIKMQNDSDEVRAKVEALKAQAEVLQQKALAMTEAMKDKTAQIKLEALKAQQAEIQQKGLMMQDQAEKLAEVMKEKEVLINEQAEKFAEIAKEKDALIKEQVDKQSKMIKEKTEKIINEDLKKQIEELKEQNEKLREQLNQKIDSIRKSNLTEPKGA